MRIYQEHSRVSARLDEAMRWNFEATNASDISRIWNFLKTRQPKLFNGSVLMSHKASGDRELLKIGLLRTSYAAFIAWRELSQPDRSAKLCFPIAAMKTTDDFYLLGTMAPHTSNSGLSYFPSGTLNDDDVLEDGTVTLEHSLIRELEEETGLRPADYDLDDGWIRIENDVRCALFKEARLNFSKTEVSKRIEAFLESQIDPELSEILFVKDKSDLIGLSMPAVQRDYFEKIQLTS